MLAHISLSLDRLDRGTWTITAAGLIAAGLMLLMARTFLGWRHSRVRKPSLASALSGDAIGAIHEDRRNSARRPGKTVKVWITDAKHTAEPFQGWIRDRSMGGLSIAVYRSVDVDSIMSVRSAEADDTSWIQVQVKRCAVQGEGRWELGCQFVRTPSYSRLLSFG
jgi:hypothetical protein